MKLLEITSNQELFELKLNYRQSITETYGMPITRLPSYEQQIVATFEDLFESIVTDLQTETLLLEAEGLSFEVNPTMGDRAKEKAKEVGGKLAEKGKEKLEAALKKGIELTIAGAKGAKKQADNLDGKLSQTKWYTQTKQKLNKVEAVGAKLNKKLGGNEEARNMLGKVLNWTNEHPIYSSLILSGLTVLAGLAAIPGAGAAGVVIALLKALMHFLNGKVIGAAFSTISGVLAGTEAMGLLGDGVEGAEADDAAENVVGGSNTMSPAANPFTA